MVSVHDGMRYQLPMRVIGSRSTCVGKAFCKPTVSGHDRSSLCDDPSLHGCSSSLSVPENILVCENDNCCLQSESK